jgi:hypothetical protein
VFSQACVFAGVCLKKGGFFRGAVPKGMVFRRPGIPVNRYSGQLGSRTPGCETHYLLGDPRGDPLDPPLPPAVKNVGENEDEEEVKEETVHDRARGVYTT